MDSHEISADNKKEQDELVRLDMIEGYREMAEENRRLAEENFPVVVEMLTRIEWKED